MQLVSIGEPGEILFSSNPQLFDLSIPPDLEGADITLRDSTLDVRAFEQGEMFFFGDNISISNSVLLGGIGVDLGFEGAIAGDLVFSATDSLTIDAGSVIGNNIYTGAIGNSGDITFTAADTIHIEDVARITSTSLNTGNAGNVVLRARDSITVDRALVQTDTGPDEVGRSEAIQTPWVSLPSAPSSSSQANHGDTTETSTNPEASWVEAQAWVVNAQGQVVLTDSTPADLGIPLRCRP